MSELCCKFQLPASNTVGIADTRRLLLAVTDVPTGKGKPICLSPFCGVGKKRPSEGLQCRSAEYELGYQTEAESYHICAKLAVSMY